jgi:hypothetical protein
VVYRGTRLLLHSDERTAGHRRFTHQAVQACQDRGKAVVHMLHLLEHGTKRIEGDEEASAARRDHCPLLNSSLNLEER